MVIWPKNYNIRPLDRSRRVQLHAAKISKWRLTGLPHRLIVEPSLSNLEGRPLLSLELFIDVDYIKRLILCHISAWNNRSQAAFHQCLGTYHPQLMHEIAYNHGPVNIEGQHVSKGTAERDKASH